MKTFSRSFFFSAARTAVLAVALLAGLATSASAAVCTNTSTFGSATINTSGALVTISTCSFGGEYSTISGAVAGQTLQFTMSDLGTGTNITIHSGTSNGPVLASGVSPLTFANTFTGTLYAHWNIGTACGADSSCHTTTVQCTSCSGPAGSCNNASSFGSATIATNGSVVTISTCSFAGEYSTISGAVAGQTLRFTSSVATDYITVRSGTSGGPILAQGVTPLVFANTFTGTIFAHWNLSSACDAQSTCRTTTVQCTSCVTTPPPANDTCASPTAITCPATVTGTTATATADGAPTCGVTSTSPGVWYSFVGTGASTTASLCGSAFDTMIEVFTGACGSLTCVTGNDDFCGLQSSVTFPTVAGTTYRILVTGFGTNSGAFTLGLTCAVIPPPANDVCTGATPIACGATLTGSTAAPYTVDLGLNFCTTTGGTANGVWYTIPGNGTTVTASLCGSSYDTKMHVYEDTTANCGALTCVAGNDDFCGLQSQVSFPTVVGRNYRILVHGFSTNSGTYILNVSCACLGCTSVSLVGVPANASQQCATIAAPPTVTATNNAGCTATAPAVAFSETTTPGSCANRFTRTRTWTASNSCGVVASASQVITVNDNTAPTLSGIPASTTISCSTAVPPRPTITATDNCDGTVNGLRSTGHEVTFTSEDADAQASNAYAEAGTIAEVSRHKLALARVRSLQDPPQNVITIACQPGTGMCGPAACTTEFTAPPGQNFANPDLWNYHVGACTPGSSVTVNVSRTTSAMDPAMSICSGDLCGQSNAGWAFGACPAGSTVLATGDDENGVPCAVGGSFGDPIATFVCPASGRFTMGVFDFLGAIAGGPHTYNLGGTNCTAPPSGTGPITINYNEQIVAPAPPTPVCPANRNVVRTWTATDQCGNTSPSSSYIIAVRDTTGPTFNGVPANVTVPCDAVPPPAAVTASDSCSTVGPVAFQQVQTNGSCAGNYTLTRTWSATDACGNPGSATQIVTVVDTTPPVVTPSTNSLACLWPPNHQYVCFTKADFPGVSISDTCSNPSTWKFTDCRSSQCDDAPCAQYPGQDGDGSTVNDCVVAPDGLSFCVRAERAASGPNTELGRDYSVSVSATDGCGNTSNPPAVIGTIHVPKSQGSHSDSCRSR